MRNELAELEVFARVVETGNFSAAARQLKRSPSSVSKSIQQMETRLGVKLFYRSSRQMTLTDDGEHIYRVGKKALDAMSDFANVASGRTSRVSGVLHVHALLTFAKYQLVPLLEEFHRLFPDLRLEFMLTPEPTNMVQKNIDVAIHIGQPHDQQLISKTIAHSRWIICAAPSYISRFGKPATPGDLTGHTCLNFTSRDEWNVWALRGLAGGHRVKGGPFGTNQGEMMLALARQGLGIVRLSEYHVAGDLRSGRLLRLLGEYEESTTDPICLTYQSRRNLSPAIRCFRDFMVEKFGGPDPWCTESPL